MTKENDLRRFGSFLERNKILNGILNLDMFHAAELAYITSEKHSDLFDIQASSGIRTTFDIQASSGIRTTFDILASSGIRTTFDMFVYETLAWQDHEWYKENGYIPESFDHVNIEYDQDNLDKIIQGYKDEAVESMQKNALACLGSYKSAEYWLFMARNPATEISIKEFDILREEYVNHPHRMNFTIDDYIHFKKYWDGDVMV